MSLVSFPPRRRTTGPKIDSRSTEDRQGQGYFKTGQCALSTGNPIGGVLADVYNAVLPDAPVTYFGDATYGKPWMGLRA